MSGDVMQRESRGNPPPNPSEILNHFKKLKAESSRPDDGFALSFLQDSLSEPLSHGETAGETLALLSQAVTDGIISSQEREQVLRRAAQERVKYYKQWSDSDADPLKFVQGVYSKTPELAQLLVQEFENDIDRQLEHHQEEIDRLQKMKRGLHPTE